ncbi:SDR family oxidoreductase [Agrilactobacillus yilanensis]|uniref:SDR family oxidoreductase n=1 Tax=Agrilactobacillus yilanensis TaxID=2485997 RepID=A0ABW4JA76_9LACO|nr:SDR family oxidoreductase [Agrilactobacillus yilanensis]
MKYAVTGVTGHFGSVALKELAQLVPAKDIIALARNVEKAKQMVPEGIEIRPGDYMQPGDLHNALKGVDRLLLVSSQPGGALPRIQQHLNVLTAARNEGVRFIAYTSFPHADTAKGALAYDHKMTETAIKNTAIQHAFLRNNWYLENELSVINGAKAGQTVSYSAGDGKVGWTLERFYAEAAAKVLATETPKEVYEFAGPSHTYQELAAAIETAIGQKVNVAQVNDDQYQAQLIEAGLDKNVAEALVMIQMLIREGDLTEATNDLSEVLGRPLPDLATAIKTLIQ